MGLSYQELVRQNWGFLSQEEQASIARARVLLAGCGLGSTIAVLAARTGFSDFVLADGDTVEASNLNRQAFRREHLGQNKAEATAQLIREISPEARVAVMPVFLGPADAVPVLRPCDLVVNMVDPGPALEALLAAAREQGKTTLFPLNVGFGGILLAFGPSSPSLEELIGSKVGDDLFLRIVESIVPALPPYLWQFAWVVERIRKERVAPPQLGVATSLTASLIVAAMVKQVLGLPIPLVPAFVAQDSREPALLSWPAVQERA